MKRAYMAHAGSLTNLCPRGVHSVTRSRILLSHCSQLRSRWLPRRRTSSNTFCAASNKGFSPIDLNVDKKYTVKAPTVIQEGPKVQDLRETVAAGPRGLLLVGFSEEDGSVIRKWFQEMEPGFPVAHCPAAVLAEDSTSTLRQALGLEPLPASNDSQLLEARGQRQQGQQGGPSQEGGGVGGSGDSREWLEERGWEAAPAWVPPVVFFSGMAGEEVVGVLEFWEKGTGLESPAFAAVTENTLGKRMGRLIKDIVRAMAMHSSQGADVAQAEAAEGLREDGGTLGSNEPDVGDSGEEFVVVGQDGVAQTHRMGMKELREQLRNKIEEKGGRKKGNFA